VLNLSLGWGLATSGRAEQAPTVGASWAAASAHDRLHRLKAPAPGVMRTTGFMCGEACRAASPRGFATRLRHAASPRGFATRLNLLKAPALVLPCPAPRARVASAGSGTRWPVMLVRYCW
jgi:hypothetical protein